MTGLEQSLAYIEREIGFMIKDDLGLPTNGRYVDKVINDCLGFSNFGTGVYHSNKPNGIIFRAMNGAKGPQFMRFFNASLHDTRMDMVSVLVEADKFRLSKDNNSKSCRKYLIELYGKSVKRMRNVIKVAKDEGFKSMYKGLKNFAKFNEYEDDDDDWDFAFSDVDFSGFEDPMPSYARETASILNHKSADEIMADITAEEARIGRKMTDAELDEFLSGPDETTPEFDDSKINLENIVRLVLNELKASGSIGNKEAENPPESLEEFLVRNKVPEIDTVVPNSVEVEVPHHDVVDVEEKPQNKSELENLVGMYNHSEKKSYESSKAEVDSSDNESSEESDSDDESSAVPPVDKMGGTESSLAVDSDWDDPHLYDSDGKFTAVTEEEVDNMFNKLLEAATKKAPPKGVDIQASIRKLEAQKAANPELVVECNTKDMERFIREMKEKQAKEEEEKKPQGKKKSRRERRKEERERRNEEIRRAKAAATTLIPPIKEDDKVPITPPSFKKIEEEIDQSPQIEMTFNAPSERVVSESKHVDPEVEHAMIVEDIISDFDNVLKLKNELKFQLNNFCNSMRVPINGMDIDITPFQNIEKMMDATRYLYNINIVIYSLESFSPIKMNVDRLCSNFRDKVARELSIDPGKIYLDVKCVTPSNIKSIEIGANTPRITPPELFASFSPASLLFADDDSDEFHKEEDEEDE